MKKTYDAYCARCESTVSITLDSGANGFAPTATPEYMDRCPSCGGEIRPVEHGSGSNVNWLDAVNEQVQHDRIDAMRRGEDPVP